MGMLARILRSPVPFKNAPTVVQSGFKLKRSNKFSSYSAPNLSIRGNHVEATTGTRS